MSSGTIYLLTSGEYSEYEVLAAFSTREAAEDALQRVNSMFEHAYDVRVETRDLDLDMSQIVKGQLLWRVRRGRQGDPLINSTDWHVDLFKRPIGEVVREEGRFESYEVYVLARTKKAALKYANHRFMQYFALHPPVATDNLKD